MAFLQAEEGELQANCKLAACSYVAANGQLAALLPWFSHLTIRAANHTVMVSPRMTGRQVVR
jgi:hypothetical protein